MKQRVVWETGLTFAQKITYTIALFASRSLSLYVPVVPGIFNLLILAFLFVLLRFGFKLGIKLWVPKGPRRKVLKAAMTMFLETNWTAIAFIIVQMLVEEFERWWNHQESPIIGISVISTPFLIASGALRLVDVSDPTRRDTISIVVRISSDVFGRVMFGVAFFGATVIRQSIHARVTPWTWFLLLLAFGGFRIFVDLTFGLWKPINASMERIKAVFQDHWNNVTMIAGFVLANMFADIMNIWWVEAESGVVGFFLFNTVIIVGLGALMLISASELVSTVIPSSLLDRVLLAMAYFLAAEAGDAVPQIAVWQVSVLLLMVVIVSVFFRLLMASWVTKNARTQTLKEVIDKVITSTWLTIIVSFVVNRLVSIFALFCKMQESAIVSSAVIEVSLLVLSGGAYCFSPSINPSVGVSKY